MRSALTVLSNLDFEIKKIKYPNVPIAKLPRSVFSQSSARDIEKAIVHCIRLHGWQASTTHVMGRPIDTRKKYTDVLGHTKIAGSISWARSSSSTGMSDIDASIVPIGGSYAASVKIEVKYGKDRQSAAQMRYESEVIGSGGVYIIVHSYDDFWEWFEEFTGLGTYEDHLARVLLSSQFKSGE